MIYHKMFDLHREQAVRVGLIGTGHFGIAVLVQSLNLPQMVLSAIADKSADAIKNACEKAGVTDYVFCETAAQARAAFDTGKLVAVTDPMLLMDLPIDVLAEATGNPYAGALHGLTALEKGKHVVMVNKETDSCVGPILYKKACEKGLVYTQGDGDQPAELIGLIEWARGLGLEIICAGKSRDGEFIYDPEAGTVTLYDDGGITIHETVTAPVSEENKIYLDSLPEDKKEETLKKRREICRNLDPRGGFDLCEMAIVANSTGLAPDTSLLYDHILRTTDLPKVLCEKKHGGILSGPGIIDVVTQLRRPEEASLGGGVFIVVRSPYPYSQMILVTKGCHSNQDGSAALIYKPYHLCGVEASTSLLCAGLLGVATGGMTFKQAYDIVQEAAIDLPKGTVLGNDHDIRMITHLVPASPIKKGGPAPAHFLNGATLTCDVKKGTMITYDMIEQRPETVLWKLRAEQDEIPLD